MSKLTWIMLAVMGLVSASFAQSTFIDSVTITAPDPNASEAGPDPGLFEVRRSGPTNYSLAVFYRIGGTASNGVDYETINQSVMIPQGSLIALIPIKPINDTNVEGPETVILQIVDSPLLCPAPACGYYIGWPSNATVTIADNDGTATNHPPFVRLDAPQNGQKFPGPTNITLRAYAQDTEDGYDLTVEFFEFQPMLTERKSLGFGTFVPSKCATCPYFELIWSNVPPGTYDLTAIATDHSGASSSFNPGPGVSNVRITVFDSEHPPGVNIYASDLLATEQPATTAHAPDTATFTLRRDNTNGPIVVYYAISGSASNGVDYQQLSGQATMLAGESSKDIVVTPIDDDLVEGTETVELTLLATCPQCLFATPQCAMAETTNCFQIGPYDKAVAYIADNDSNPPTGVNIYATDPVATEQPATTDQAPDTAKFTVRRSDTNGSIVVYYDIGGSASNGVDYEKLSGQVTLLDGESSAGIVVMPIDDNLVEGTETVELTLIAPCPQCLFANPPCDLAEGTNCYPIGANNSAVAYIRDNDSGSVTNPPVVTIMATDPIAVEGDFCGSNWWWTTPTSSGGWTTNSGPASPCPGKNTAIFEVRRSGQTNSDLTVYYIIGGTASNGIDYVRLANHVVIPTGRYATRIEVVPIDDNIAEPIETVVLSLTAPTRPFEYLFGDPRRAAAIILDDDQPRPACRRLSDGLFHVCAPGTNGFTFCVHTSSDLINWTPICTNVVTEGAVHFVDPDAADLPHRFYRVTPDANYSPPQ